MVCVDSVTRCFGGLKAVDGVTFRVGRGEVVGFLGPNGAGKSTVLKMLATFLPPTSGRITIDGLDVGACSLAVRRRVGYLAGDTPLYPQMRVAGFLRFVGAARGLEGARLGEALERVVELFGLGPALEQRVAQCSTGFRQRIGRATALIHDPPILLLDEPTHGFDPLQLLAFRQLLRRLRPGRAILFSTHIVGDAEAVSDRVLVIHQGRLLADGSLEEVACRAGQPGACLEAAFAALVKTAAGRG
ncbi:MAG: ABC transporter ATP-binding protein [Candidatus Latescibacterota bacterium]